MSLIVLDKIEDLSTYRVASADLSSEYWTPGEEGEVRRVIFWELSEQTVPSQDDPTVDIKLECAVMLQPAISASFRTRTSRLPWSGQATPTT
jgi:hypothetical protein